MNYSSHYRLGPSQTPKPLKILILATFMASILSALLSNVFPQTFGLASPQQLFGLSVWGIHHLFLWQFVTYFFIHPILHGISFSFLLSLGFSLYLMWVIGSSIIEKRGTRAFLSLYFSSGIFVGIILFFLQQATHSPMPFAGNTPILYAVLMGWVMLYPEAQLLLLLALPVKAKWLILSILCANLLIDLSVGEWIGAVSYFAGALFGYFYPIILWGARGPFPALHPFEEKLGKIFGHNGTQQPTESTFSSQRGKIYDFKTGKAILNDDEFLDEMLSKISAHGKGSLTWKERFRLRRISRRKKKEKE